MPRRLVGPVELDGRTALLAATQRHKMARSPHAFVRGNTIQFYDWLESLESSRLPHGPAVWICGDAHLGNLGPVGGVDGSTRIVFRDLDQTVIGNPAHDLIRLALSLASAARGSNLPGVTTARMLEAVVEGYDAALADEPVDDDEALDLRPPRSVQVVMKQSAKRTWKHLADDRLDGSAPTIPIGKRFWPVTTDERGEIAELFAAPAIARLATLVRSRDDDSTVEVLDAAYWMKGCSSLGRLRYAVLLRVHDPEGDGSDLCLMDVKEATPAAAPAYASAEMPSDHAERVVEGARHLSPRLGERMAAARLADRPVVLRELRPQDLKVEMEQVTAKEVLRAARFLAAVVGRAHARQMDDDTRADWRTELQRHHTKAIDAPSWLWSAVVELLVAHEGSYLEHCRRYLLALA